MTSLAVAHSGLAFRPDVDDLGHLDVVRAAAHRDGDVDAARADGELAETAGGRRVAVGPEQGLAGRGEVLLVDVVADAVARSGEIRAVGAGGRPQEAVVVGVLEVELVGLMVAVLRGELGLTSSISSASNCSQTIVPVVSWESV